MKTKPEKESIVCHTVVNPMIKHYLWFKRIVLVAHEWTYVHALLTATGKKRTPFSGAALVFTRPSSFRGAALMFAHHSEMWNF